MPNLHNPQWCIPTSKWASRTNWRHWDNKQL